MTIEPAYAAEQSEWVDAFYYNVQNRMLNLYESARLEGSTIDDRKKIAAHWLDKLEWFSNHLTFNSSTESNLKALKAPVPSTLAGTIQTLIDIVAACKDHY